jgi:hypothetical protein
MRASTSRVNESHPEFVVPVIDLTHLDDESVDEENEWSLGRESESSFLGSVVSPGDKNFFPTFVATKWVESSIEESTQHFYCVDSPIEKPFRPFSMQATK